MTNTKGEVTLPPIKTFTIEDSVKDQARKVLEEAAELFSAANEYEKFKGIGQNVKEVYLNDIISEALDTIQAVCNLLEMLNVWDDDIVKAYELVFEKNKERGRYDV